MRRWAATLVGESLQKVRPDFEHLTVSFLFQDSPTGVFFRRVDRLLELILGYSPKKLSLLKKAEPNLIHVHFATDAVKLWPTARRLKVPVLVTLHGYDINTRANWWREGHGGPRMKSYPDRLLAMADHPLVSFIAVSETIRSTALSYGLPGSKIAIKRIGIPIDNFTPNITPPSKRNTNILFVGRLVEKKGANFLIEAAASILEEVPTLRLILIGGGTDHDREQLESLSSRLKVNVTFMGAQPHSEVKRQLGLARALCLPSITSENGDAEGLPISVLEAQAAGLPVVTTATGGCAEAVVDQETGFLVAERDIQHLASALKILMLDGHAADRMGINAAKYMRQHFDISKCTAALEDHYDLLISQISGENP